jgi:hypothetical protein
MVQMFEKYRNKNCNYPFSNEPLGYCWGYAHHIDGTAGFKNLDNLCTKCEFKKSSESILAGDNKC